MDRNVKIMNALSGLKVALRKESVDRNIPPIPTSQTSSRSLSARRAWIEIFKHPKPAEQTQRSLSARRAWIEIGVMRQNPGKHYVALRKESVDRNPLVVTAFLGSAESLSARRAWIEMAPPTMWSTTTTSLSARRAWIEIKPSTNDNRFFLSLSARRAWIEIPDV